MRYVSAFLIGTALAAAPALAQQTSSAPSSSAGSGSAPASTTPANVSAGQQVNDTSGASVGTIESVSNGNATVNTGTTKVAVPVASFAQSGSGLVLGMTKAQLEAAVASAKPTQIAVGTAVQGPKGNPVGTVAAVSGDLVTVQTAKTKVQLPKNAFATAQGGSGLVIGMTAEQLDAAAAAAVGGKTGN